MPHPLDADGNIAPRPDPNRLLKNLAAAIILQAWQDHLNSERYRKSARQFLWPDDPEWRAQFNFFLGIAGVNRERFRTRLDLRRPAPPVVDPPEPAPKSTAREEMSVERAFPAQMVSSEAPTRPKQTDQPRKPRKLSPRVRARLARKRPRPVTPPAHLFVKVTKNSSTGKAPKAVIAPIEEPRKPRVRMKVCGKCKENLPNTEYGPWRNRDRGDVLCSACRGRLVAREELWSRTLQLLNE